ncbi:hypothetical protein J6590_072956 [Homalodisca vitripennis]|nr:hypothetical protein J6590_072956 [Homalodisca vitripennis]
MLLPRGPWLARQPFLNQNLKARLAGGGCGGPCTSTCSPQVLGLTASHVFVLAILSATQAEGSSRHSPPSPDPPPTTLATADLDSKAVVGTCQNSDDRSQDLQHYLVVTFSARGFGGIRSP